MHECGEPLNTAGLGRPARPLTATFSAVLFAPPLASDGQADEVAHGRAADEAAVELLRQAQKLAQHAHGARFDLGGGAARRVRGILVIGGGQPIAHDGGRRAAAGDEPEVAPGLRCR